MKTERSTTSQAELVVTLRLTWQSLTAVTVQTFEVGFGLAFLSHFRVTSVNLDFEFPLVSVQESPF